MSNDAGREAWPANKQKIHEVHGDQNASRNPKRTQETTLRNYRFMVLFQKKRDLEQ